MTRLRTSTTSSSFSHSSLRWSVASSLLLLALVACTPAAPATDTTAQSSSEASIVAESTLQAGTGTVLTIELQTTQTEDEFGTPLTTAVLRMSGTLEGDVTLPPITGTLSYVDPRSYIFAPPEAKTTTLAVLSAWFAGGGQEVAITRDHINGRLLVWYRAGDEGTAEEPGVCTPLEIIASHNVPAGTEVRMAGFLDPIAHSALNYCGKPLTK